MAASISTMLTLNNEDTKFPLSTKPALCNFSDRQLLNCLEKINQGLDNLEKKSPNFQRPEIKSGLRGTRYFIEFPIVAKNFDAFQFILQIENLIKLGKAKHGARVIGTDSFIKEDNVSYKIDFENNSSTAMGGKSNGTIYLRGIIGQ